MRDTLAITYEGMSQIERNKLSLLTHKYELIPMEENEDILSYPNFVRGPLFGGMQPSLDHLEVLNTHR